MAEVLTGHTATMSITNVFAAKIKIEDEDSLWFQWLDIADKRADTPEQCTILHLETEDRSGFGFFTEADKDKENPFFIDDFIVDGMG